MRNNHWQCRGVHAVRPELRGRKFSSSAYNRLKQCSNQYRHLVHLVHAVDLPTTDMVAFPTGVVVNGDVVEKLEHETTRPFIADVTTTERVEVRQ